MAAKIAKSANANALADCRTHNLCKATGARSGVEINHSPRGLDPYANGWYHYSMLIDGYIIDCKVTDLLHMLYIRCL